MSYKRVRRPLLTPTKTMAVLYYEKGAEGPSFRDDVQLEPKVDPHCMQPPTHQHRRLLGGVAHGYKRPGRLLFV